MIAFRLLDPDLSQPQDLHRFHMMLDVQTPSCTGSCSSSVTLFQLGFLSHAPRFRTLVFGRLPHRELRSVCFLEPLNFAEQPYTGTSLTHSPRPCDQQICGDPEISGGDPHEDTKVPVELPTKDLHPKKKTSYKYQLVASYSENPSSLAAKKSQGHQCQHMTPQACVTSAPLFSASSKQG